MDETVLDRIRRHGATLLVAGVTVYLIALLPAHLGSGAPGVMNAVVYALTAGFGLEFCGAVWSGAWRRREARHPVRG